MEAQNAATILKTLKTIHWALVAGASSFAAVAAFQVGVSPDAELFVQGNTLLYIPAILALFMIPTALILFNKQIEKIKKQDSLEKRMRAFQSAHIVRVAMLEGVALFAIVVSFVTLTTINFFVFGLAIILMAGSLPTTFKLTEKLGLTREEQQKLEGNEA